MGPTYMFLYTLFLYTLLIERFWIQSQINYSYHFTYIILNNFY